MRKRLLSMLLALSVLGTMMWTSAMAVGSSPIPVEYLPQVENFIVYEEDGTAAVKYRMPHSEEYPDHYTKGYRALIWGENGNRNSVFSGYLIDDEEEGQTAGDQKLRQELGMNFFDELPAGYTPILSGVVAFMSVDPLYTQETGYGVNVTVEDSLDVPENIEELSGDGPVYGVTLGRGFEKGKYYLQLHYANGNAFTATGTVTGPTDTLYVDGTTAGDLDFTVTPPTVANAVKIVFWRSTCTGLSDDGKTVNFAVTKKQEYSSDVPPAETEPEVTVEDAMLTASVSAGVSSDDQSALEAVLSKAAVTGMKDALNETSVDKIAQASGVGTTDVDEIKVQLKAELTVTAADLDKGTISFEVAPAAEVTAGSETKTVSVDNSYLNGKNITVKLPIPAGFIPKEILHISKGKPVEQYLLNNGFTVEDGTAVLYIDHFSELRMNESQTTVAKIEGSNTGYFSLQSAIDAAGSDAKINLYNNSDDTVLKVANKSLTINCNTYKLRSDVDWQLTNCTKSETTDEQNNKVIVITYTGGGSSSGGGGGSSSSSNKPTASVSGSGGKVTVASDGTVTITPDAGYQIAKITVNGKEVDIPANGKLTGLDKDDKVVVTFEKIPEEKPDESTTPFTDVAENAWYADAVQYVYEKGIMNGTSTTSFSPNETTTRAMIVTMLHRLEDTPSAVSSGFTDVAAGAWYADAVAWAAANGVVNGISDSSFAPETAITREQLATILYRYAQLKGYDVSVSGNLSGYADVSQISEYAITAMQWANENGLITGNTATTLNPQGNATRAEVATILMRFIENMG